MYVKCAACGDENAEFVCEEESIIWLVFECSCISPGALPHDLGEITEHHTRLYLGWSDAFDWAGTSLLGVRHFIEMGRNG